MALAPQPEHILTIPDACGGREHRVAVFEPNTAQFVARLRKMAKQRRKWAKREGVFCYRVYDADLPDYAAAIDIYEGAGKFAGQSYVHIAEYAAPREVDAARAAARFADVCACTPVALGIDEAHAFVKTRQKAKGGAQYADAGGRACVLTTCEAGQLMEVDLGSYLDTGIFLDHRVTRGLVGKRAQGTRFLNLFAYTGTATVHAAAGGAVETTTVDLSQTYLDWARRNMRANGFSGANHRFERGDVMAWLDRARRDRRCFDFVFVDPPTFSNSKAMGERTWDVQRDHIELLDGVVSLLAPGGSALFSCNLRSFKPDLEELGARGIALNDITAQTIPLDFERNPHIHCCYEVSEM